MLTESEALTILPLSVAKLELRIADSIKEHDALIQRQIWDAVNYCSESTGRGVDDLMPLRAAAMTVVRQLYDRARELGLDAAAYALLNPFRKRWAAKATDPEYQRQENLKASARYYRRKAARQGLRPGS